MPELMSESNALTPTSNNNFVINDTLNLKNEENDYSKKWNATNLLNKLYNINYNPLVEKRSRFRNMEGHLEIPNEEPNLIPEIEKEWKKLYFRTKDGRFQRFATHFADEHPISDILLTGTIVTSNRENWTIEIKGGKENANIIVKTPSNLYNKWYQAILSHSQSSLIDAYVQPCYPPVPHYTHKVVLIEIGTCSVRAGLLTNKISLPQVFFPSVGCIFTNKSDVVIGTDAFTPANRCNGQLENLIQVLDSQNFVERFKLDQDILYACLQKVIKELQIDPSHYKILISIPQNVLYIFAPDLLRTLLQQLNFQAACIVRQPSLILYSYDVTTGIVVDIGERLSIVPIIDEYIVENAIVSIPFGALNIRKNLQHELSLRNQKICAYNSAIEEIILRYIVEQACYVAVDFDEECNKKIKPKQVKFDSFNIGSNFNSIINIDSPSFLTTEGLFQPIRWDFEIKGIHHLIHNVIQQSPIDSRRTLYRNIYLSGGTSLLPGFAERLETELCKIAPASIFVQVHGSPWRYHASYLGSQVFSNSFRFENCCATLKNLDEYIRLLKQTL